MDVLLGHAGDLHLQKEPLVLFRELCRRRTEARERQITVEVAEHLIEPPEQLFPTEGVSSVEQTPVLEHGNLLRRCANACMCPTTSGVGRFRAAAVRLVPRAAARKPCCKAESAHGSCRVKTCDARRAPGEFRSSPEDFRGRARAPLYCHAPFIGERSRKSSEIG